MDPCYNNHQTLQTTNKDTTYELVKKLSKFIMLFSVFTFFLSNPSWLSLFLHSFISHVSSFPSQLLSHINDKNYIFLLCNGILVILAKSSWTLINGNSESLHAPEAVTTANEAPPVIEPEEEEGEIPKENEFQAEEEGENGGEEISEKENEEVDECYVEAEELGKDPGEERSITRMSTDDLNRKFEEFIRRMKEEIRIEAQQQLVKV